MIHFASILDGLDATWYFFTSSGAFIVPVAGFFGFIGLWTGFLTWGRYKRRWRAAADELEGVKSENALLKRRSAELATRANIGRPVRNVVSSSLAALIQPRTSQAKFPAANGFSLWTAEDWEPSPVSVPPLPPGRGFSIWPLKRDAPVTPETPVMPSSPSPAPRPASLLSTVSYSSGAGDTLIFDIEHHQPAPRPEPKKLPRSHAFCIWTEKSWKPVPVKVPPLPRSSAFCVWTADDWKPPAAPKPHLHHAVAHPGEIKTIAAPTSVSTVATPHSASTLEPRGAAGHPPRSAAFSIWTEAAPEPASATNVSFANWLQAKAGAARNQVETETV